MQNLLDAIAKSAGTYLQTVTANSLSRSVSAIGKLQSGTYGTTDLGKDIAAYLRDLADFRVPQAVGFIPTASLRITGLIGPADSQFIQVPAGSFAHLHLTPMVNAVTQFVLPGFKVRQMGGENSVFVEFDPAPVTGTTLDPRDKKGLFQGAIFNDDADRIIAFVLARTQLP
jgi:hypothetical protein